MARDTLVEGSTLTDIANAIRDKDGSTAMMHPNEMAGKILAFETGVDGELVSEISSATIFAKDSLLEGTITANMGNVTVVKFVPNFSGEINFSTRISQRSNGSCYVKINGTIIVSNSVSSGSSRKTLTGSFSVTKDTECTITVNTSNTSSCTFTNIQLQAGLFSTEVITII